jgi:tetratricopeptide (TPR) repeat protein
VAVFETQLRAVRALASAKRYDEALVRCRELLDRHPKSTRARGLQASIKHRLGDYAGAVSDADELIRLKPRQPLGYFERGRYLLTRGSPELAIADFTEVLRLSDLWQSEYYVEAGFFYRAEALIRCRRFGEARRDCARLSDGFTFWADGLRTKDQMLAECAAGEINIRGKPR